MLKTLVANLKIFETYKKKIFKKLTLSSSQQIIDLGMTPNALMIVSNTTTIVKISTCFIIGESTGASFFATNGGTISLTLNLLNFTVNKNNLIYHTSVKNTDGNPTATDTNVAVDIYVF